MVNLSYIHLFVMEAVSKVCRKRTIKLGRDALTLSSLWDMYYMCTLIAHIVQRSRVNLVLKLTNINSATTSHFFPWLDCSMGKKYWICAAECTVPEPTKCWAILCSTRKSGLKLPGVKACNQNAKHGCAQVANFCKLGAYQDSGKGICLL